MITGRPLPSHPPVRSLIEVSGSGLRTPAAGDLGFRPPTQRLDGLLVEIAVRHGRVRVSLSPEKAPDITAILEQQRRGVILRMTLEEHEEALSLLHEGVDPRALRPRQHAIAARQQGFLGYLI